QPGVYIRYDIKNSKNKLARYSVENGTERITAFSYSYRDEKTHYEKRLSARYKAIQYILEGRVPYSIHHNLPFPMSLDAFYVNPPDSPESSSWSLSSSSSSLPAPVDPE